MADASNRLLTNTSILVCSQDWAIEWVPIQLEKVWELLEDSELVSTSRPVRTSGQGRNIYLCQCNNFLRRVLFKSGPLLLSSAKCSQHKFSFTKNNLDSTLCTSCVGNHVHLSEGASCATAQRTPGASALSVCQPYLSSHHSASTDWYTLLLAPHISPS